MTIPLHLKYRPQELEDVIGQDETVRSLKSLLSGGHLPHAFLFTGPSGVGKTTLARILATAVGCEPQNLLEIDAATNSGVESMREVLAGLKYRGMGSSSTRVVIVDEAHALSKQTWASLLLAIEEPPEYVYWALCTTEVDKVPKTIKTRCHTYNLRAVTDDQIYDLLAALNELEELKIPDSIVSLVSRQASGSVRQALVYLSQVHGVTDKTEALRLIQAVDTEDGDAVTLARMIVKGQGFTWDRARVLIKSLEAENPESIRLVVVNYLNKAITGPEKQSDKEAARLLAALSAFSTPCNPSEGIAPVLLAVGGLIFGE